MSIISCCIWPRLSLKKTASRGRIAANPGPLLAVVFINLALLSLLGIFSWLREQPLFWRNIGGWPIWLRDLVWLLFYPVLLLEIAFLLTLTAAAARCVNLRCPYQGLALVSLVLLWSLWLVIMLIVVWNNLENLVYGRPLHWHEA